MSVLSVSVKHTVDADIFAPAIFTAEKILNDKEVILVGPVGVAGLQSLRGGHGSGGMLFAACEVVGHSGGHLLHRVRLSVTGTAVAGQKHRRSPLWTATCTLE